MPEHGPQDHTTAPDLPGAVTTWAQAQPRAAALALADLGAGDVGAADTLESVAVALALGAWEETMPETRFRALFHAWRALGRRPMGTTTAAFRRTWRRLMREGAGD